MEILGVLLGLGSMIMMGLSNAIAKTPIKRIGSELTVFYRGLFMVAILFVILLFSKIVFSPFHILFTLLLSVIGYFALASYYKGFSVGNIGVISTVSNSSIVLTILLSVIFLHEKLNLGQIFSIALIILGVIFISMKSFSNGFKDLTKGLKYALITWILWGIMFAFMKIPALVLGPIFTSLLIELGVFGMAGIWNKPKRFFPKKEDVPIFLLISTLAVFSVLCHYIGITVSSVSIVTPLTFAGAIVTTMYGRVIYKEKLSYHQYAAVLLVVMGIIFLVIS
jgi:bacterial/archaeal transporter family protein